MINILSSLAIIQSEKDFFRLRILLFFFSLMFSVYALITDDIINSDGILYMQMAKAFIDGGLAATASLYDWPFYSILIALFSQFTGLSTEISAGVLNAIFFAIFTDFLLLISRQLLPQLKQTFYAALLILFFYTLNNYRDFIIRDIGYWAFTASALYCFIRFLSLKKMKFAFLWQLSMAISILFRIEGVVLLLAMPFYVLFVGERQDAIKSYINLNLLSIVIPFILILISLLSDGWTSAFGKLISIIHYLDIDNFIVLFKENANIIASEIMHPVADEDSKSVLFLGLIGMVFFKIFLGLSPAYILMYLLSIIYKIKPTKSSFLPVILYFLSINFLILLVFSFKQYFITGRYAIMAMVAVFLLFLPRLCALIEEALRFRKKSLSFFIITLMIFTLGDAAHKTNSKSYIPSTASWAADNLSAESKIITSSKFIAYYFNKKSEKNKIKLVTDLSILDEYDYFIQIEKVKPSELNASMNKLQLKQIYKTENRYGDKAVIYKVTMEKM